MDVRNGRRAIEGRTMGRLSMALALVLVAGLAYTGYVGYEGSRQAVDVEEARSMDCRTPDVILGWAYEAINYDISARTA